MSKPYSEFSTRKTPQREKTLGSNEIKNSEGGYVHGLDKWKRLERFLILGSEGGTYYIKERPLTQENANVVLECLTENGYHTVRKIADISSSGRAAKNDPALFALAMAASVPNHITRKYALDALPEVARTGTHLFHFASYVENFRGWGRGLRKAIASWYNTKSPEALAYQVIKYKQRDGWSHRDLLRLSHAMPRDSYIDEIFNWVVKGGFDPHGEQYQRLNSLLWAADVIQKETDASRVSKLIHEYNLPREVVPTQFLNNIEVWEALFERMPMTAMLRNLGKMTSIGLISTMSDAARQVAERATNLDQLKAARVHPIAILMALQMYARGEGFKGSLKWTPAREVLEGLNESFYISFGAIEPTNQRIMYALDVSLSMTWRTISGTMTTPREGSAALALVMANVEPHYLTTAFASKGWHENGILEIPLTRKMSINEAIATISDMPAGGTDCSLPMLYAIEEGLAIDLFVILTDSETWAGEMHVDQALEMYRQKSGRPAKLVTVGMVSNGFSIANPNDPGMLDVVGFDTQTPQLISDFAK